MQDVLQRIRKEMLLSYNSVQHGRIAEYLLGLISASSTVMLSRCCYTDLRHGKKLKLSPQSCRPSLTTAWPEVISNEEF